MGNGGKDEGKETETEEKRSSHPKDKGEKKRGNKGKRRNWERGKGKSQRGNFSVPACRAKRRIKEKYPGRQGKNGEIRGEGKRGKGIYVPACRANKRARGLAPSHLLCC